MTIYRMLPKFVIIFYDTNILFSRLVAMKTIRGRRAWMCHGESRIRTKDIRTKIIEKLIYSKDLFFAVLLCDWNVYNDLVFNPIGAISCCVFR